jgi:hypothetical protein
MSVRSEHLLACRAFLASEVESMLGGLWAYNELYSGSVCSQACRSVTMMLHESGVSRYLWRSLELAYRLGMSKPDEPGVFL